MMNFPFISRTIAGPFSQNHLWNNPALASMVDNGAVLLNANNGAFQPFVPSATPFLPSVLPQPSASLNGLGSLFQNSPFNIFGNSSMGNSSASASNPIHQIMDLALQRSNPVASDDTEKTTTDAPSASEPSIAKQTKQLKNMQSRLTSMWKKHGRLKKQGKNQQAKNLVKEIRVLQKKRDTVKKAIQNQKTANAMSTSAATPQTKTNTQQDVSIPGLESLLMAYQSMNPFLAQAQFLSNRAALIANQAR